MVKCKTRHIVSPNGVEKEIAAWFYVGSMQRVNYVSLFDSIIRDTIERFGECITKFKREESKEFISKLQEFLVKIG